MTRTACDVCKQVHAGPRCQGGTVTVFVCLPEYLVRQASDAAVAADTTRSAFLRRLITRGLDELAAAPEGMSA